MAEVTFHWPADVDLPGYRPTRHGPPAAGAAGGRGDRRRRAPRAVRRRRHRQRRGARRAARARRGGARPRRHDADAKGAFPDSHPLSLQMPGMHGSKYANWALHQSDLLIVGRRALRRSRDGQARRVRPRRARHPHGHRPGRDLEEPACRHPDRRRAARGAAAADRGARRAARDAPDVHAPRLARHGREVALRVPVPLPPRRRPQAAVRARALPRPARRSRRRSTRRASASTRCGRPSGCAPTSRGASSPRPASARWASASPRRSAPSSGGPSRS